MGTSVTKITNHFHLRSRSHCHFSKEGEEEGETGVKTRSGRLGRRRGASQKVATFKKFRVWLLSGVLDGRGVLQWLAWFPFQSLSILFPLLSQSDTGGPQSTKKSGAVRKLLSVLSFGEEDKE